MESDFHLIRLLAALTVHLGDQVPLEGKTLLGQVDLGFYRMSEDADLVVPGRPSKSRELPGELGAWVILPGGERFARRAHIQWRLEYP